MITFSKIYKFLRRSIKKNKKNRQNNKQEVAARKQQLPAKPPSKRILITYGIFSLLCIIVATTAWFFKHADFSPPYFLPPTNTPHTTNEGTEPDNQVSEVQKQHPAPKPTADNLASAASIDKLNSRVKALKNEIKQLNAELDVIRIQQYIANARYLINTGIAPEQALSVLQAIRADIEAHPDVLKTDTIRSRQNIDNWISNLQQYIKHSPKKSLALLAPLIANIETKLGTISEPQMTKNIGSNQTNESWVNEWLAKIYNVGKSLIKIEYTNSQYIEDNRLLLKLLIVAQTAVLLNEQEQFNIALQDALKIVDTMAQPPITSKQIETILSLKIVWKLPQIGQ